MLSGWINMCAAKIIICTEVKRMGGGKKKKKEKSFGEIGWKVNKGSLSK